MNYATKEDLAEVKAMIDEIKSMIKPKEEMSEEVSEEKEELSEEVEEVKEELSAEEPVAKVTHNPEAETKKNLNLFAQKRTLTTADRVLQRISNIKK
jgi:tRNA nucleotidyltransferase (CCA-adding enzyme)